MDLGKYIEELKQDCIVDEINLKEAALVLPAKKAKWVSRLILEKNNFNKLEKERKQLIQKLIELLKEEAVVNISIAVLKSKAEQHEHVLELDAKMQQSKNTIDFFERVEKIMSSMSFDVGNIIKIVQLETT
jgi:hypothetical protein